MRRAAVLLLAASFSACFGGRRAADLSLGRGPVLLEPGAAALGGTIYVAGGLDAQDRPVSRAAALDTASGRWNDVAELPFAADWPALAAHEGRVYAAGGRLPDGSRTARVVSLAPGESAWREEPPLPEPLEGLLLVSAGGRLYAVGGRGDGDYYKDSLSMLEADRWVPRAPLPVPGAFGRAVAAGDNFFLVGGLPHERMARLAEYETGADRWVEKASLAVGRHAFAAGFVDGKLVVAGGASRRGSESSTELFDPSANRWSPGPRLPRPRDASNGVVVGRALYVVGGRGIDERRADADVYFEGRWRGL